MMRTVNAAFKQGITSLRMIHDSYATHASDVEKLQVVLRKEFIRMYKDTNLLEQLYESVLEQHADAHDVKPVSTVGDFDIKEVQKGEYFFA